MKMAGLHTASFEETEICKRLLRRAKENSWHWVTNRTSN